MLPERLPARVGIDRSAKIEKPREHTSCVRFDDWGRLMESKAGHCMRSVFPDSGELSHSLDVPWEVSTMAIHNGFGCGVEISRASVITEPLPHTKHRIFRSAR